MTRRLFLGFRWVDREVLRFPAPTRRVVSVFFGLRLPAPVTFQEEPRTALRSFPVPEITSAIFVCYIC